MKLIQSSGKNYIIMEAWCFEVNDETFATFLTRDNFAELAYHETCRPKGEVKHIAENTLEGAIVIHDNAEFKKIMNIFTVKE